MDAKDISAPAEQSKKERVVILHNCSNAEISAIMKAVKSQLDCPKDIIFAKTTPTSLQMKVDDLIDDLTEDHQYLQKNPPNISRSRQGDE